MENGVSLILPAYKEAGNLKILLPKINTALQKLPCGYEILVIDTIEPLDNTKEVCLENNAVYLPRKGRNLYGDAVRTGIAAAGYSRIVIMDADGSHNPDDILKLYQKIDEGFDICIGSRYVKGGNTGNSFILKLMSCCVNLTFRILFNLKVKDVSNSFRMYNAEKLKNIKIECSNFDLVEEILIKLNCSDKNIKIAEIPIYFDKRIKGVSKRNLFVFILSYFKTIYKLLRFKAEQEK